MNSNVERELKLEAPDGFSLARAPREMDGYVASRPEMHRLHTVYYDTEDFRLMRWGCSLRYRRGEGWTLKLPVPSDTTGLAREEHVFPSKPGRVPSEALDLAFAYLRGKAVGVVADLRTLRVSRVFRCDGTDSAEVVEDDVHVVESARVIKRFRQIEIELEEDTAAATLDAIAEVLREHGAGPADPTPKDVRAVGDAAAEPEIAIPPIRRKSPAIDVLRAAIGKVVTQFIRMDAKLRITDDPEAVHDARVAVRRLRSYLRCFLPLLEADWATSLRERLAWLQDQLSLVRDADVLFEALQTFCDRLPGADAEACEAITKRLQEARTKAREQLREALHDERYISLLNDMVDAARAPRVNAKGRERAKDIMKSIMRSAWNHTRKAVRRAGRVPSDRDLHRIRIKSKHLRYAAEVFASVAGKRADHFVNLIERVQTVLGNQHDGVVAMKHLREMEGAGGLRFAAGELASIADMAQCGARAEWKDAWSKARRRRVRFW